MSRLIKLFQKFNIIDKSVQDPDISPTIPAFVSTQEIPKELIFVTGRIVLIPFPDEFNTQKIAGYLNTMYSNKYMVWNLSEHLYRSEIFNGQVLDFVFVGYPNPPLGEIFAIFNSISGWLESDLDNVAVIHCQQTKARSYMVVSAYLAWQNRESPLKVFQQIDGPRVTKLFPSQYRYLEYIHQVVQGARPCCRVLHIKKVIISGLGTRDEEFLPYIQFYKDGKNIFSTLNANSQHDVIKNGDIINFNINLEVSGDFILRCRQVIQGKTSTIFRTMVHTAFCDEFSLRFHKQDLDSIQEHLNDDFLLDVFYVSQLGEGKIVPENLKNCSDKKKEKNEGVLNKANEKPTSEEEDEEEEKVDLELLEKYKAALAEKTKTSTVDGNESSSYEEEDYDDYFQKLEMSNKS